MSKRALSTNRTGRNLGKCSRPCWPHDSPGTASTLRRRYSSTPPSLPGHTYPSTCCSARCTHPLCCPPYSYYYYCCCCWVRTVMKKRSKKHRGRSWKMQRELWTVVLVDPVAETARVSGWRHLPPPAAEQWGWTPQALVETRSSVIIIAERYAVNKDTH